MSIRRLPAIALASALIVLFARPAAAANIAGFGRIEPDGGIVNVSANSSDTIARILVQEGQHVDAGQVLAVLGSRSLHQLQLDEADLNLKKVQADGASDLQMEEEHHKGLTEERDAAKERLKNLYANKAQSYVSPGYIANRQDDIDGLNHKLELSGLKLQKLKRSQALAAARAEKQVAIAKEALDDSTVRSPEAGRVLKVLGRPGEHPGPVLFMIGNTSTMFVLAEVYESDALSLKVGQKATISSNALPVKLLGTVQSVGTMIYKSNLDSVDTAKQSNSRVLEALIKLKPNSYAAKLINLQVDVVIQE